MADPTPPPTNVSPNPQATGQWIGLKSSTDDAKRSLDDVADTSIKVKHFFDNLDNTLGSLGDSFKSLSGMTGEQAAQFGMVSAAVLGATTAFTNLASVDTTRLITFSGQLNDLFAIIEQGPGTQVAKAALSSITDMMLKMGATAPQIGEMLKGTGKQIIDASKAFFQGADNALRLQNSMMQLTLQGSGSKALFESIPGVLVGVGDQFQNLEGITTKYRNALSSATVALGGNQEQAAKYMAQINKMPGGLTALLGPMDGVLKGTSLLVDSIDYFVGSGRDQESVLKDLNIALVSYKTSGEDALRFSGRMSEVADALSDPLNGVYVQVHDVQTALLESADAFKMFVSSGADAGKMTQGMADSMKDYVYQLTSVGVPAQNAIEMFRNYTNTMKGMNISQQAFVSGMSGGPGGLRGAFQMDNLIRQGKFDELRQKVEATIRKMTGPIVSLDEAQRSESAAAQYTRQIQLLQQGPLGQMAKTRPEAEALLQAMRDGKKLPTTGKSADDSLLDTMKRGQKWQEGTFMEAGKAAASLKNLELLGQQANLKTARGLGAGSGILGGGIGGTGAGISSDQRDRLLQLQNVAKQGMTDKDIIDAAAQTITDLPKAIKDAAETTKESVMGNAPPPSRFSDYVPAGGQLGPNVAPAGVGKGTSPGSAGTGAAVHTGGPIPVVLAPGSEIHVNFTGACPHCGRDVHTTEVARTGSQTGSSGPGY